MSFHREFLLIYNFYLVEKLNNLGPNENAEEFSGQVEGDMLIDVDETTSFNGRVESRFRWANNTVHYWIDPTFFGERKHIFNRNYFVVLYFYNEKRKTSR